MLSLTKLNKQSISQYFFNNKYFILFVLLLSIPNFLMWYYNPAEKANIANLVTFLFYEIIILLPVLVFKLRTVMIFWLLFIFLIPLEIIHIINYDGYTTLPALSSALDSNPAETGEFISNYRHIFLLALFFIPAAMFSIFKTANRSASRIEKVIVVSLFLLFSGMFSVRTVTELGVSNFVFNQTKLYSRLFTNGYPTAFFYNITTYVIERKKLLDAEEVKKQFLFNVKIKEDFVDTSHVAVLIIGETSRAKNWSLNGYERETNPNLAKLDNLVYFDSAITAATHTRESIQFALTRARPEDMSSLYKEKSIIGAYQEAGYKTVWISNQNKLSTVDTPVTAIARESNAQFFTNKDYEINPSFDEDLLPMIKNQLADKKGKLLIIVHTLGSHEVYRKRYTKDFEKFTPVTSGGDYNFSSPAIREKLVNSYDNSILYTDYIIASIIKLVNKTKQTSFVMYFSDHGENLLDDGSSRFGHGGVIPTHYVLDIPVLLWFSDEYISKHRQLYDSAKLNKHKSISLNELFDTMLELSGLSVTNKKRVPHSFFAPNTIDRTVLTTKGKVIIR